MRISFVIATLNRKEELTRLLQSFVTQTRLPDEIVIVDQGGNGQVEIEWEGKLPIHYYAVDFKSLTKARNFGVEKSGGEIVCFLDDDIILASDYTQKIEDFFSHHHEALGVQGVITDFEQGHIKKVGDNKVIYFFYNLFAKFFLLNSSGRTNKLLWSGRNQYASRVKTVSNCEWLSGIGNYRRQVFNEFEFDEHLTGYALGEDKLFSYQIFKKYPRALFVDPGIKCEHHHPDDNLGKSKEWVEMKIKNTIYIWKNLLKSKRKIFLVAYWWANLGDLIAVFCSVIIGKNSFGFLRAHFKGYWEVLWKTKTRTF